ASQYRPGSLLAAVQSPVESDAGSEIQILADVVLPLVAQPGVDGEFRSDAPVVLQEHADVVLLDFRFDRARCQRKLACASPQLADGLRRHSLAPEEFRAPVRLNAGDRLPL